MQTNLCRLCGQSSLSVVMTVPHAPRNIQRLFKFDDLHLDRAINLEVLGCGRCGFVQIEPLLEDAYYDNYLMTTTHSGQMQEYQARQARDFVQRFGLEKKLVKEIGCGDGSYLDHLRDAGALVSGIEPSTRFRELAVKRGFNVENGYVSAQRQLEDGPYDGFVTRQVLEHVPDIHGFLTGIRLNLKPGAVGLIEVPSLEKALSDRRFYDFFPDHVNYFALRTLRLALEINGFDIVDLQHGMFDEYNVALVKMAIYPSLDQVGATVNSLGGELREFISRYRIQGKKVAMWGAGGKGLSVMAAAGIQDLDLLVDGDSHKQGLFTPVSPLKVEAPSILANGEFAAVVITAMAYRSEIERILCDEYRFRGDIAVLGHHLEITQLRKPI
ncbi:MAG: methyltransferase domain-containing protein [Glaciimonas sp.]|nr:methyltransferase domain-containing protein [Glaciimonas sp.]